MTALNMPIRASYADLLRSQLLSDQYCYPKMLMELTQEDRTALFNDPLTPVERTIGPIYRCQRELLRSFSHVSTDHDLRMYARGTHSLSTRAWDYFATCGKPNYLALPAAVEARTISNGDAKDIARTFRYWEALQMKVRPFVPSAS